MLIPRVRIHKIVWLCNDGEVWYTGAGVAVNHLRELLGSFSFAFDLGLPPGWILA